MKFEMEGKTVIVTGCNRGIGKETVRELAKKGARIIMACRNLDAANATRDEIVTSIQNYKVIVKKLDISSFESIRDFAKDVNATEKRLDVLIHNAGYAGAFKSAISADGIELTMATNHYGPFLLTNLLIELLRISAPSKIVILSSTTHHFALFDINNPNPVKMAPFYLYCYSKLANIWFTKSLARRLQSSGIVVNCLHPGLVDTDIWEATPAPFSWILNLIHKWIFITPLQGCQTIIKMVCDDSFSSVTGKYFYDGKVVESSWRSNDEVKAEKLWVNSEKIALADDDPRIEFGSTRHKSE